MTKPELPEWIDKIDKRMNHGRNDHDAWLSILKHSPNDVLALLEHCIKLREVLELYALPSLVAHGIDAGLDMETIKNRTAYLVCAEVLNSKPEGVS